MLSSDEPLKVVLDKTKVTEYIHILGDSIAARCRAKHSTVVDFINHYDQPYSKIGDIPMKNSANYVKSAMDYLFLDDDSEKPQPDHILTILDKKLQMAITSLDSPFPSI